MKNIIWGIVTIIAWLFVAMMLEYDYRQNDSEFIKTFSPLQWFVFLTILWSSISIINFKYLLSVHDLSGESMMIINIHVKPYQLAICIIPITHILVLLYNFYHFIFNINQDLEKKRKEEFEELWNKKTVQDKVSDLKD